MRIDSVFVYEFVTGGGFVSSPTPTGSMLAEGAAMLEAVVADFAAIADLVYIMWDERLPRDLATLPVNVVPQLIANRTNDGTAYPRIAQQCEKTLVIAPETDGLLFLRTLWLEVKGRQLLSPGKDFIDATSDKNRTAERLAAAGVSVPQGRKVDVASAWPPADIRFPLIAKPADRCGSDGVRFIASPSEPNPQILGRNWRLEEFSPGLPASIAVLCGPQYRQPLAATKQLLSGDGQFSYLGCELPLAPNLQHRAERLALAALAALPPANGYVGIDLILGDATDGSQDVVIEINPRLTTSYVALRQHYKTNLAAAMLQVIAGQPCELEIAQDVVSFRVK